MSVGDKRLECVLNEPFSIPKTLDFGNDLGPPTSRGKAEGRRRGGPVGGLGRDGTNRVLVHGAAAHSGWWHGSIGPLLRSGRRVVAIDLSGHGTSAHRESYSVEQWARDLTAVFEAIDPPRADPRRPWPRRRRLDPCLSTPRGRTESTRSFSSTPRREAATHVARARGGRSYESCEEAIGAFRLVPEQPVVNPDATMLPGRTVCSPASDGRWGWRFDPRVLGPAPRPSILEQALAEIGTPVAFNPRRAERAGPSSTGTESELARLRCRPHARFPARTTT